MASEAERKLEALKAEAQASGRTIEEQIAADEADFFEVVRNDNGLNLSNLEVDLLVRMSEGAVVGAYSRVLANDPFPGESLGEIPQASLDSLRDKGLIAKVRGHYKPTPQGLRMGADFFEHELDLQEEFLADDDADLLAMDED